MFAREPRATFLWLTINLTRMKDPLAAFISFRTTLVILAPLKHVFFISIFTFFAFYSYKIFHIPVINLLSTMIICDCSGRLSTLILFCTVLSVRTCADILPVQCSPLANKLYQGNIPLDVYIQTGITLICTIVYLFCRISSAD